MDRIKGINIDLNINHILNILKNNLRIVLYIQKDKSDKQLEYHFINIEKDSFDIYIQCVQFKSFLGDELHLGGTIKKFEEISYIFNHTFKNKETTYNLKSIEVFPKEWEDYHPQGCKKEHVKNIKKIVEDIKNRSQSHILTGEPPLKISTTLDKMRELSNFLKENF